MSRRSFPWHGYHPRTRIGRPGRGSSGASSRRTSRNCSHLLTAHSVNYLVVGGYAVAVHARPRYTDDLHLFVSRSSSNAEQVRKSAGVLHLQGGPDREQGSGRPTKGPGRPSSPKVGRRRLRGIGRLVGQVRVPDLRPSAGFRRAVQSGRLFLQHRGWLRSWAPRIAQQRSKNKGNPTPPAVYS
jgi:hypothetical protein